MTTPISRDLGHGVRVMPGDGGGIVVLSANLDLGWRPREDDRPGSAVMWEGSGFEVVEREPWRRGARWILEPWRGEDVMRVVLPLDSATVATNARTAQTAIRAAELRPLLWIGSPILGFASASRQRRWRDDYGFPATLATSISAIGEIVVGTLCVIEIVVSMFADEPLFPWIPRMLVPLGLVVFIEGAIRLAQIVSDPGPVGSLFGLPFTILDRRESPSSELLPAPTVRAFDAAAGTLELLSTIHRRDWEEPGILPYRGELFTLAGSERFGESWVYEFHRVEDAADAPATRLRLVPPRSRTEGRSFADQRGAVETVLLSIAATLAPRRFQERWAGEIRVRPFWFTLMGASAELLGGLANLGAPGDQPALNVLISLFFCGEAIVRFSSLVFRGRPLGSVLGLPLAAILDRYLPEGGRSV
jgi:hypothetical protein